MLSPVAPERRRGLLGAVVAALTMGMRRAGILSGCFALPLYAPGAGVAPAASRRRGVWTPVALLLLGAGSGSFRDALPLAAAAALRIAAMTN